jgi:hypothetical protein
MTDFSTPQASVEMTIGDNLNYTDNNDSIGIVNSFL